MGKHQLGNETAYHLRTISSIVHRWDATTALERQTVVLSFLLTVNRFPATPIPWSFGIGHAESFDFESQRNLSTNRRTGSNNCTSASQLIPTRWMQKEWRESSNLKLFPLRPKCRLMILAVSFLSVFCPKPVIPMQHFHQCSSDALLCLALTFPYSNVFD